MPWCDKKENQFCLILRVYANNIHQVLSTCHKIITAIAVNVENFPAFLKPTWPEKLQIMWHNAAEFAMHAVVMYNLYDLTVLSALLHCNILFSFVLKSTHLHWCQKRKWFTYGGVKAGNNLDYRPRWVSDSLGILKLTFWDISPPTALLQTSVKEHSASISVVAHTRTSQTLNTT